MVTMRGLTGLDELEIKKDFLHCKFRIKQRVHKQEK